MRTFVLRARAASTNPERLLSGVGQDAHSEILAHTLMNAMFIAQSHRDDVVVHLVLDATEDYPRTITFEVNQLGRVGGFHEAALMAQLADALKASAGMGKGQARLVNPGVEVRTQGFEKLIKELAVSHTLYVMDKKGESIRQVKFASNPCFILTDHIPMPKNSLKSLQRMGVEKISLGPTMLFASQCIVLIHNELDLAG